MMEYFTENATLTVGGDFGEGHRKYCKPCMIITSKEEVEGGCGIPLEFMTTLLTNQ